MGRIIAEIVDNRLIVTEYKSSDGFVIPDKIVQDKKVVATIKDNIDTDTDSNVDVPIDPKELAVPREEFLIKLLSMSEGCVSRYSKYGKGLYSEKDMKKGITWAEVTYLLHYVGGVENSIDWSSIKPRVEDRVCVLHEIVYGKKKLDEKLASYKNRVDMEYYIGSIISGKRYIPLPLYCSFVDLSYNEGVDIELNLDMMFKKISVHEFNLLF